MQCVIHSTYFVKPGTRYEFKTHLTNHYLEIRCGKNFQKVVKAIGNNIQIHITYFNNTNV